MDQAHDFDGIILLANLMDADGNLNEECAARVECAVQAYLAGRAPLVVACGWDYRDDSTLTIAEAMKRHACARHGVPPQDILLETGSRDTVGDAYFTKLNLAAPRAWQRLAVVTSHYHAERTREVFEFIYGPAFSITVIAAPSADTSALRAAEARSVAAFRATFDGIRPGDDLGILERLRSRHPFYNGQVYAAI